MLQGNAAAATAAANHSYPPEAKTDKLEGSIKEVATTSTARE